MADENNASGQEENGGNKPNPDEGKQQPSKSPDASGSQQLSPEEQARRAEQSEKDKQAAAGKDDLQSDVDFLKGRELERQRDEHVKQVLSDKEKYPDVKADDPMFKYAASPEEVEEIATNLQSRFKDMQQDALRSVREEPDVALTDEQIEERDKEREKEMKESGKSTFGSWLGDRQRRKK